MKKIFTFWNGSTIELKYCDKEKDIEHFYKNLSWEELIIEAGEINNSIEKIKELTKVYDVEILTHVNSDGEIIAKLNYFKEVINPQTLETSVGLSVEL